LQQNHEMLLAAFHFSGTIDRDEFKRAVDLLNKRLPEEGQFGDPDELFSIIDGRDGSGEINIDEFGQILQQMAVG
jgi:Ca2+-binding EF-hand superfamily protein